jgi:hypothetical protein
VTSTNGYLIVIGKSTNELADWWRRITRMYLNPLASYQCMVTYSKTSDIRVCAIGLRNCYSSIRNGLVLPDEGIPVIHL